MNHLDDMDYLREGIGLRGYGQRDPLVEYKKEGYILFQNLLASIRNAVVNTIFKIGVMKEEPAPQKSILKKRNTKARKNNRPSSPRQRKRRTKRNQCLPADNQKFNEVGRNDPCPCGSGKKYKKCCGRNLFYNFMFGTRKKRRW